MGPQGLGSVSGSHRIPSPLEAAGTSLDNRWRKLDKRPLCLPSRGPKGTEEVARPHRAVRLLCSCSWQDCSQHPSWAHSGPLLGPAARPQSADVEPRRTQGGPGQAPSHRKRSPPLCTFQTPTVQNPRWMNTVIASMSQKRRPGEGLELGVKVSPSSVLKLYS